jgi:uncharacterized membrane-anchored protein YitT (DUF2179 family)
MALVYWILLLFFGWLFMGWKFFLFIIVGAIILMLINFLDPHFFDNWPKI